MQFNPTNTDFPPNFHLPSSQDEVVSQDYLFNTKIKRQAEKQLSEPVKAPKRLKSDSMKSPKSKFTKPSRRLGSGSMKTSKQGRKLLRRSLDMFNIEMFEKKEEQPSDDEFINPGTGIKRARESSPPKRKKNKPFQGALIPDDAKSSAGIELENSLENLLSTASNSSPTTSVPYTLKRPRRRNLIQISRESTEMPWMKKEPDLSFGTFKLNGETYQIEQLDGGKGTYHKVFRFITPGTITIGKRKVSTNDVLLKILNRLQVGPNKDKGVITDDVNGYKYLVEQGVPVATVFADPVNFVDSSNPKNGKFWIVEKMPTKITGDSWKGMIPLDNLDQPSKNILSWAKSWLNEMAKTQKDLINDFRKRNTMLDCTGSPKIIDYSLPETEAWEIEWGICRYVIDWANENPSVLKYLISDFPKELQDKIEAG